MKKTKSYPELIRASHIRKAAASWDAGEAKGFRQSLRYDVLIKGRPYPPKAIVGIAHEFAVGSPLKSRQFAGAKDGTWHKVLKREGFAIVPKGMAATVFEDAVRSSLELPEKERRNAISLLRKGPPLVTEVTVRRFIRSPDIVAQRLFLAKGKCGRCKKAAPFKRRANGEPYLEVHHVKPLFKGGWDVLENTLALCPNCHADIHDELRTPMEEEYIEQPKAGRKRRVAA